MTTLYLDMNIYNRPFDDQGQMRIKLETMAITMVFSLIESGLFSARWSFVLDYENSRNPFPERRAFVQHLSQICENTIEPNEAIKQLGQDLTHKHGVRGRDALHLACAEWAGCHYLVTCDDRLIKQSQRLRQTGNLTLQVLNPIDLLRETKDDTD